MKKAIVLTFLSVVSITSATAQNETVKGLKQGPWVVAHEGSKVIRYKGQFDNGIPVGIFTHYHTNGKVHAIMKFRASTGSCYSKEFSTEGKLMAEGIYASPAVKDSIWRIYNTAGELLTRETYRLGILDGPFETLYPSGMPMERGVMKNGKKDGGWTQWSEKGYKIRTSFYSEGMLNGIWTEYDHSGKIMIRGKYEDNLKEGIWTEYHEGKPIGELHFSKGRQIDKSKP